MTEIGIVVGTVLAILNLFPCHIAKGDSTLQVSDTIRLIINAYDGIVNLVLFLEFSYEVVLSTGRRNANHTVDWHVVDADVHSLVGV